MASPRLRASLCQLFVVVACLSSTCLALYEDQVGVRDWYDVVMACLEFLMIWRRLIVSFFFPVEEFARAMMDFSLVFSSPSSRSARSVHDVDFGVFVVE